MLWPIWPGCAFLVAVLLLAPRRIWPTLITAGLAGFVLYDVQVGLPLRPTAYLIVADTAEVLIAALGLSYTFDGLPRLDSLKALARYSLFAVILAPLAAAFITTAAFDGNYWIRLRIGFFTEALALLILTPAILSWVSAREARVQKSRALYFEAATLIAGLSLLCYLAFVDPARISSPALLYSLLPFLLWSALRFGIMGISTSMIVVAFLSIWGAIQGRGPFTGSEPLNNVMSLQLFLFFAVAPFMVLAVLVEERKQTEHSLRKSEERFRLAAQAGKMYAFEWDVATDRVTRSEEHVHVLGLSNPAEQLTRQQLLARVHADDRASFAGSYEQLNPENPTIQISYRFLCADGSVVWVEKSARAFFDEQGKMLSVTGMVVDITERKLAEAALASVSRRLIEAQEQERTRIGRELHDDIGQRLALLADELEQLHQDPPNFPEVRSRIGEVQKQTSEIATDIQTLSHELHSAKLEYLGIAAAMRGFCQEFGEQQNAEIDFQTQDLPIPLSPDISLCFYRVLQEALHNSAKHSGVRHFEVRLWGTSGEIHLTVRDSGAGFELEAARKGRGLGLISMQERVKFLKGTFSIESQLQRGTTIHARVPLRSESDSLRAAG
jgi:PAS domain S-box-containing protein